MAGESSVVQVKSFTMHPEERDGLDGPVDRAEPMRRPRRKLDGFTGFDGEVLIAEDQPQPAGQHIHPILTRVHRQFGFPELALLIDDLHRLVGRDGRFTPWRMIGEGSHLKPFACMIEPPTLDARISAQTATFTLCSDTSHAFDVFLAEHDLEDALTRFVIKRASAACVRDQLDLAGMDERRLFPDLDGVAAQMRRYYS